MTLLDWARLQGVGEGPGLTDLRTFVPPEPMTIKYEGQVYRVAVDYLAFPHEYKVVGTDDRGFRMVFYPTSDMVLASAPIEDTKAPCVCPMTWGGIAHVEGCHEAD